MQYLFLFIVVLCVYAVDAREALRRNQILKATSLSKSNPHAREDTVKATAVEKVDDAPDVSKEDEAGFISPEFSKVPKKKPIAKEDSNEPASIIKGVDVKENRVQEEYPVVATLVDSIGEKHGSGKKKKWRGRQDKDSKKEVSALDAASQPIAAQSPDEIPERELDQFSTQSEGPPF